MRFLWCLFFVMQAHVLTAQQPVDSMKVATFEWNHLQQMKTEATVLLQEAKKAGQANAELIKKLQTENEKLREIMRGYIQQIDTLNEMNQQLTQELEKCGDGK